MVFIVFAILGFILTWIAHNIRDAVRLNIVRLDIGLPPKPICINQIAKFPKGTLRNRDLALLKMEIFT